MAERLSEIERGAIAMGDESGLGVREIARLLGRNPSTVSRELRRNALSPVRPGRRGATGLRYSPWHAERLAAQRRARPKPRRITEDGRLRREVVTRLRKRWSPRQVSADLVRSFPDDASMHVSHEAIYQAIYLQGRGSLRAELADQKALRSGRRRRKPQGRAARAGKPWVDLRIADRPAEADDRAMPGHWEGDLLLGAQESSAIATLVERTTRFVILVALPEGRVSEHVVAQLSTAMGRLPEHLRRTLAWDQGAELAQHARFTVATGCPVYFCDPHSPWQRGSNENTNGLLRDYFPKGKSLKGIDQTRLDQVADELNTRPRQTLGWDTPAQRLDQLLLR